MTPCLELLLMLDIRDVDGGRISKEERDRMHKYAPYLHLSDDGDEIWI